MGILNKMFGGSDPEPAAVEEKRPVKPTKCRRCGKEFGENEHQWGSVGMGSDGLFPSCSDCYGKAKGTYPPACGAPLDRCYLRPLQTPLWDTEIYDPARKLKAMTFFERPRRMAMLMATDAEIAASIRGEGGKTEHDTCLDEPGMLTYPYEFSILGFKFFVEPGSSHDDVAAIMKGGLLKFGYSGRKEYLEIPLEALQYPMTSLPPEKLASDCERIKEILADPMFEDTEGAYNLARRLLGMEPCHRFNIGRSALKIKPHEPFGMSLSWAEPPQTSRRLRLTAMIVGLWWSPL